MTKFKVWVQVEDMGRGSDAGRKGDTVGQKVFFSYFKAAHFSQLQLYDTILLTVHFKTNNNLFDIQYNILQ